MRLIYVNDASRCFRLTGGVSFYEALYIIRSLLENIPSLIKIICYKTCLIIKSLQNSLGFIANKSLKCLVNHINCSIFALALQER